MSQLLSTLLFGSLVLVALNPTLGQQWVHERDYSRRNLKIPSASGRPLFTRVASSASRVDFVNRISERSGAENRVLYNGSGVALGDVDGDGRVDLFLAGLESPSKLYLNQGEWRFKDATSEFGLIGLVEKIRGGVLADVDGDGDLDLLVSTHDQGILLFKNDDHHRFVDATADSGLAGNYASTTLTLADVDQNGTVDLYVACYRADDIRDFGEIKLSMRAGKMEVPERYQGRLILEDGVIRELGEPDRLYLNDGKAGFKLASWVDGRFLDATGTAIMEPPRDWGLSASFRDLNGDRLPDLYVCNDFWTPDRIWINRGGGMFQECDFNSIRKTSASSMGVDFSDIDRDGDMDFVVVDMLSRDPAWRKRQKPAELSRVRDMSAASLRAQVMRNTVFENLGSMQFRELAFYSGLEASDWSWSPFFMDVDLDGYEDLIITAGHFKDVQDLDANRAIAMDQTNRNSILNPAQRKQKFIEDMEKHNRFYPDLKLPMIAFKNQGNWTFKEMTGVWFDTSESVRHGMASADLDGDGDLDLVVNNLNHQAELYCNQSEGNRVLVRLSGRPPNTSAIGASVTLRDAQGNLQVKQISAGGRYLSGGEMVVVFACDPRVQDYLLEIAWPSGAKTTNLRMNPGMEYLVVEPDSPPPPQVKSGLNGDKKGANPDGSSRPLFSLHQTLPGISVLEVDDFSRQPLMTIAGGRGGPGLVWRDLNQDGIVDLVSGGPEGKRPRVWIQNGNGVFESRVDSSGQGARSQVLDGSILEFQSLDENGESFRSWIQASNGYSPDSPARGFSVWDHRGHEPIADEAFLESGKGSLGCVALTYVGPGGVPILFCGGGVMPGKYPSGSTSMVFQWIQGKWRLNEAWTAQIRHFEPVNSAIWAQLSGDNVPELVLACETGPVRVFMFQQGKWAETTVAWGLEKWKGFWRGIHTADFDGNGLMDLAVTNLGNNTELKSGLENPYVFYHGTLFRPGIVDIIETTYQPFPVIAPRRPLDELVSSLPFLMQRVPNYKSYSESSMDALLGDRKVLSRSSSITTLYSTLFLNMGNRFVPLILPREAQCAVANGLACGDFNGDGQDDLFIVQNEAGAREGLGPWNEGRGLVLLNDGLGLFQAMSPAESGVDLEGTWRSVATADFNQDGRLDVAVADQNGSIRIFRNASSEPGLGVHLIESGSNPHGEGVRIRLESENHLSPWKSILTNGGFRSQDQARLLFFPPSSRKPVRFEVTWTDGSRSNHPIQDMEPREIWIKKPGS